MENTPQAPDRVTSLEEALREKTTNDNIKFLQINSKMDTLATRESIEELLKLLNSFKIGVHVSGQIFSFSGKFIMYAGGIAGAITAIVIAWKTIIAVNLHKIF